MGQWPPLQANRPKLPIFPGGNDMLIPWPPDVPNILPVSHIHMSWHGGWCGAWGTRLPGAVQPVANDIPIPSRHVELAQYADDTALAAMSRSQSLLVGYLEANLGRLERWLRDWRIAINVPKSIAVLFVNAARRIQKPRAVQFLGEPVQWVETSHLGWPLILSLPGGRTSTRWERR
jgi:hypothetical protein